MLGARQSGSGKWRANDKSNSALHDLQREKKNGARQLFMFDATFWIYKYKWNVIYKVDFSLQFRLRLQNRNVLEGNAQVSVDMVEPIPLSRVSRARTQADWYADE